MVSTIHSTRKRHSLARYVPANLNAPQAERLEQNDFADVASYRATARGHGRVEARTDYAVPAPLDDERLEKWTG
jgi:hypothetical protein